MAPVVKPVALGPVPRMGFNGMEPRPEVRVEVGVTLTREVLGRPLTVKDLGDLVVTCRAMDVPGEAVVLFAETVPAPGVEHPHNFVAARVAQVRDVRVTNPGDGAEDSPAGAPLAKRADGVFTPEPGAVEDEPGAATEEELVMERCGECEMGLGTHNLKSPNCINYGEGLA